MKFPTYPPDILSRADALLSSKYPDGIVDPRFVEVACEAMMSQREFDAAWHDQQAEALEAAIDEIKRNGGWVDSVRRSAAESHRLYAKAIRGAE
jgi:hypothetical protein